MKFDNLEYGFAIYKTVTPCKAIRLCLEPLDMTI